MNVKKIILASLLLTILLLPIGEASAAMLASDSHAINCPVGQVCTPAVQAVNPEQSEPEKVIYLTFDDGPDPNWTPQILDILDRYHAGATFYMIGRNAVTFPEVVRQVAEHKQRIAIHGYNHMDMSNLDYQTFYLEVNDSESVILAALQSEPNLASQYVRCLRPPYGLTSDYLYQTAHQMGYEISMWNIDTNDWQQPDPDDMLADILKILEPGKVILMHDGGKEREKTLLGLQLILHELIMQGYRIEPLCNY